MKAKDIVLSIAFVMLLSVFIAAVLIIEFYDQNVIYYVICLISVVLIMLFYLLMFYRYKRQHKIIQKKLKEDIEKLRPESELRTYGFMEQEVKNIPEFPEFEDKKKK